MQQANLLGDLSIEQLENATAAINRYGVNVTPALLLIIQRALAEGGIRFCVLQDVATNEAAPNGQAKERVEA